MPRYEPDLTKVAAGIPIFPKGAYEFSVGEPKAFAGTNRKGDETNGIRYSVKCVEVHSGDTNYKDKRTVVTCNMHNEGGQSFSKQFIMAALGFAVNDEQESAFNAAYGGRDWSFDPDSGAVGDVWREPTGRRLLSDCDVTAGEDGTQFQKFAWRPLKAS